METSNGERAVTAPEQIAEKAITGHHLRNQRDRAVAVVAALREAGMLAGQPAAVSLELPEPPPGKVNVRVPRSDGTVDTYTVRRSQTVHSDDLAPSTEPPIEDAGSGGVR